MELKEENNLILNGNNLKNNNDFFIKYKSKFINKKANIFKYLLFLSFWIFNFSLSIKKFFDLNKILKIELNFVRDCINDKERIKPFQKYNNPKMSLVIPIYNDEKYILRLMKSIQKQAIKEIEIIFIEDCSIDNSLNIIEEYNKIDKRIKLIKNGKNKGCLYSYAKGILEAKANYTMIIDQDELLLSNLNTLYKISKKYNKDINDFSYLEGNENDYSKIIMSDRELIQPDLGEIFFTGGYVGCTYINKKIYKTETIKNAIRTLKDEYLNSHIVLHCDTLLFICFFYNSKSYRSFGKLFSQFNYHTENSATSNLQSKYNKLFSDTIYLVKYISELKYSSKENYNRHIEKALGILEWPIKMEINKPLIFDWNKFNITINGILKNKELDEINIKRINKNINIIKKRNKN